MVNGFLLKEKLEDIFQRQWSDFIDYVRLMRRVMEDVRDTSFREIRQQSVPPLQVKMSITNCKLSPDAGGDTGLELWVEFSIPKDKGVVIGTSVYLLTFSGDLSLKNSFGTYFLPEN